MGGRTEGLGFRVNGRWTSQKMPEEEIPSFREALSRSLAVRPHIGTKVSRHEEPELLMMEDALVNAKLGDSQIIMST